MAAGALFLLLAWAGNAGCAVKSVESITLTESAIHLHDLVQTDCLSDAALAAMGNPIVAALPDNVEAMELSRDAIAELVRRRVPVLTHLSAGTGERPIILRRSNATQSADRAQACFAIAHAVRAGQSLRRDDLSVAPCVAPGASARIHYDRTQGVARAAADLAAGDYVGRLNVPAERYPDAGDALTLSVSIGPVRIERSVVALQPAPHSEALFVQDASGAVFRAPLKMDTHRSAAP